MNQFSCYYIYNINWSILYCLGYERNDDRRGGGGNYGSRDGKDSRSRDDRGSGRDRSERSKY